MTVRLAPRRRRTTVIAWAAAICFAGLLLAVGLNPAHVEAAYGDELFGLLLRAETNPDWAWVTFEVVESAANVLIFVPLGFIAFFLMPRSAWPVALLIGPVVAVGIESGQYAFLPSRDPSWGDVAANSVGSVIGFGIAVLATLIVARHPPPSTTDEMPQDDAQSEQRAGLRFRTGPSAPRGRS